MMDSSVAVVADRRQKEESPVQESLSWPRRFLALVDRKGLSPWIFLGPFLLVLFTFSLFPIFFSIYLSFHQWNPVKGLSAMEFVGFENYLFAFEDPWLWNQLLYGFRS